jgi:serine/threonine protein kinase
MSNNYRFPPGTEIANFRIGELLSTTGSSEIYYATPIRAPFGPHRKYVFKLHFNPDSALEEWKTNQALGGCEFLALASSWHSSPGCTGFFIPLSEEFDLFTYASHHMLGESEVRHIIWRLIQALVHIHGRGWIYADLKMENVLMGVGSFQSRLCDFGLVVKALNFTEERGTWRYWACEMAKGERPYTKAVDMWAAGVLTYELLTWSNPFDVSGGNISREEEKSMILNKIRSFENDRDATPCMLNHLRAARASDSARDFVWSLLNCNPAARMTTEEALMHPFLCNEAARDARFRAPESGGDNAIH